MVGLIGFGDPGPIRPSIRRSDRSDRSDRIDVQALDDQLSYIQKMRFGTLVVSACNLTGAVALVVMSAVGLAGTAGATNGRAQNPRELARAVAKLPSISCTMSGEGAEFPGGYEGQYEILVSHEGVLVQGQDGTYDRPYYTNQQPLIIRGSVASVMELSLGYNDSTTLVVTRNSSATPGEGGSSHTCRRGLETGGGNVYPTTYVPREVVDVPTNDVLNVREKPTANSSIIKSVEKFDRIWVVPSKAKWFRSGWFEAIGGEGAPKFVYGWVNRSFISPR